MDNSTLIGRQTCFDILAKRAHGLRAGYRQNVAIIGDELIGKTHLISHFIKEFCDNHIVIAYLEIRPEPLENFARRFISVLLYSFLTNSALPLQENLQFLAKKANSYIPLTTKKINDILLDLKKRKTSHVFSDLLGLCDRITQETGKFCLVIFDEFHNLENLGIKNLYREWSRLLISQKNTMYIVASSRTFKAKHILSKDLSLLFGNFEIIPLEPFDTKTSHQYLEHNLPPTYNKSGLRNFLVHFTGGHPFYLKVIADEIGKRAGDCPLSEILRELLFETSGILHQRFSNYLKCFLDKPRCGDSIPILYQVSCGHTKIKDLAHIVGKTKKELMQRVSFLLESDAVSRSGDFLKINDRVFGFWLRFVYQEKLKSLTCSAENQKANFCSKIEATVQEFISCAQKPIMERVAEVMRLFEGEVAQIEKKRLRLTPFREIKPMEFTHRPLKEGIIGRSSERMWIMAFKTGPLTEEDISEFAKECKKYRKKLEQKIIVTFRDIDSNARLRALEEKIITWDADSLNQIFDLFSQPRIIV